MTKPKRSRREREMSPVHAGAAAIDVGATMHVAAVGPGRDPEPVRSFGTFTADLHRLADWFKQCGIKTVAMESTGVYWIPAFEILEQRSLRKILPQQPVGVLVRAALPRAVRVAEVDGQARVDRQLRVLGNFRSLIPRSMNGAAGPATSRSHARSRRALLGTMPRQCRAVLVTQSFAVARHGRQMQQHGEPRRALDQGADGRTVEADDEVSLPVARHRPVFHFPSPQTVHEIGATSTIVSPRKSAPAAPQDGLAAWGWLCREAKALGADPTRLAIAGASGGGGIAAATALMIRDEDAPTPLFQSLNYPMIDDRNDTPSAREISGLGAWDRENNVAAWKLILGDAAGGPDVSPYAASARAATVHGLPPTCIIVGELDLLRDEDMTYATRLLHSGVATELHVFPGAYHGWDLSLPTRA